jgi:transcription elongation factor GreB
LKKPILKKPLTKRGQKLLAEEHEWLRSKERPKTVDGIATAAAEGDRSENAEYIYGKKKLRELDKRLRYLDFVLKDAQIVDPDLLKGDTVCFGSTVTIITEEDEKKTWTIVGEGETEHTEGSISWRSPVALGLLGKKIGQFVLVKRPAGEIEFEIIDIYFGSKHYLQT